MTLWRPPRSMSERTARAVRSMQSGSIDGRIVSARPVSNTNGGLEDEEYVDEEIDYELPLPPIDQEITNGLTPWTDQFTGGGTALVLTYNPYRHPSDKIPESEKQKVSLHVYWNGVFQEDSTYSYVYSKVTRQTFVLLKSSPKHKTTDIITCKYWYTGGGDGDPDSDAPIYIGTYVKGTGKLRPLPFFPGGWVEEPRVGFHSSTGTFETMQYACLSRGMPSVTMGFKTLGKKIPLDLPPEYNYYWFFDGTREAALTVAGKRDATAVRFPCQFPSDCRSCCGFGFGRDCGPSVCMTHRDAGGSWSEDGSARPAHGGKRVIISGSMGKTLAERANENTATAVLDPAGWGGTSICVCTMFTTCVDGTIWGYSGNASYSVNFWLGVTLIITDEELSDDWF